MPLRPVMLLPQKPMFLSWAVMFLRQKHMFLSRAVMLLRQKPMFLSRAVMLLRQKHMFLSRAVMFLRQKHRVLSWAVMLLRQPLRRPGPGWAARCPDQAWQGRFAPARAAEQATPRQRRAAAKERAWTGGWQREAGVRCPGDWHLPDDAALTGAMRAPAGGGWPLR